MSDVRLDGLDGANPLGYLAALGVLRVLTGCDATVMMSWTGDARSVPVVHGSGSFDQIVDTLLAERDDWMAAELLDPQWDDVKFRSPVETREWLDACGSDVSNEIAVALVAEGSVDNNGSAKPTDLHFTAGQQKWLVMARDVRDAVDDERLRGALLGPWTRRDTSSSFGWDLVDDRVYALSARNPSKEKKTTEAGAEWLAFRGLSAFPVVATVGRTKTPGFTGTWKNGRFRWPLWSQPLGFETARSLIGRAWDVEGDGPAGAGLERVFESPVRRSDQGGYGSFGPSTPIWAAGRSAFVPDDPFTAQRL